MYILDTNIVSETIRKSPDKHVIKWLSSIDQRDFFLSVITLGEIRKGVEKIKEQAKKQKIIHWLERDLVEKFAGRIISIDVAIADKWVYLLSSEQIPAIDALIAASALVTNMKLVTRNVKDFRAISGLELLNPFEL